MKKIYIDKYSKNNNLNDSINIKKSDFIPASQDSDSELRYEFKSMRNKHINEFKEGLKVDL